jgi:hypothetical protein
VQVGRVERIEQQGEPPQQRLDLGPEGLPDLVAQGRLAAEHVAQRVPVVDIEGAVDHEEAAARPQNTADSAAHQNVVQPVQRLRDGDDVVAFVAVNEAVAGVVERRQARAEAFCPRARRRQETPGQLHQRHMVGGLRQRDGEVAGTTGQIEHAAGTEDRRAANDELDQLAGKRPVGQIGIDHPRAVARDVVARPDQDAGAAHIRDRLEQALAFTGGPGRARETKVAVHGFRGGRAAAAGEH